MQQASRSAAVPPALSMQSPTLRSLAISLAIVLVTTRSPVNGFTLRKIDASVDTPLEVESILQNTEKNLHPSYNETDMGLVHTTNKPESLKTEATTYNDTGTTLSKVDVNPTVTEKDTMTIPTVATIKKSTAIENNYYTLPTTIHETLKQATNNYESSTNIIKTNEITSLEKQVTTEATQYKTSSEHGTTTTSNSLTTMTKLDTEVLNISPDRNVSPSVSTASALDVTVSMDTSTGIPETSTMESLKITTSENEHLSNKYDINDSNSATVSPFILNELVTDYFADMVRTTKSDELLPITLDSTTNKISNEVLSISDTKSVFKQVLNESTLTTSNLKTSEPTESTTNFIIIDEKPNVVNISGDNTVFQEVFTDPPSDIIMSASTIVTSVSELSKESFKATASNNDHSTKFDEPSSTIQEAQSTKVPDDKTVAMDLNTEVPSSSTSANKTVQVTIIDFSTNTTEVHVDEKPTTGKEFVNTETLQTDTMDAKTTIDKSDTITTPPWKKYITIDRNRTSTTSPKKSTKSDSEMVGAEDGTINLGKFLTSNSPIPSVIELEKDFLKYHDYTTTKSETSNRSDRGQTTTTGQTTAETTDVSKQVETHTTLDIVTSKRAGYIDNTATTSPPQSEPATTVYMNKDPITEIGLFGQMYDTESNEPVELKTTTNLGSQSRLAEDAMKEELMIEKVLREHDDMQEDTHDDSPGEKAPAIVSESPPNQEAPPPKSEVATEDTLSVKPIKKKLTLYTVSSNYKPLKKLDVQPAKQFVRDPDDNSWRNESISSLGIVFKPKNASKSFTEVLKNKTTELSNIAENNKSHVPDLRVRLEKIAEVRKSKKKKINMYGDTVYSDYEESSKEGSNSSDEKVTSPITPLETTTSQPELHTVCNPIENYIQKERLKQLKEELAQPNKNEEIYDDSDDYDADYVTKLDLKKFTIPFYRNKNVYTTVPPITFMTEKTVPYTYYPERQPTVQYFPPTKKNKPPQANKVYESEYRNLKNPFIYKEKTGYTTPFNLAPVEQIDQFEDTRQKTSNFLQAPPQGGFVSDDDRYAKPTYIIKQVRDKTEKDEVQDFLSMTEAPVQGVTMNDINKFTPTKVANYDYDGQFRRDIVHRFVDNFNQNSDKYKVDFPILYNSSVVHRTVDGGKVLASSSTFVKRLYESTKTPSFLSDLKPCDVNCENMKTVDLSPAYELHYYVPDQEEKEEVKPQPAVFPFQFRL